MPERPTGTVTFLFTDIKGSTRLWEHHAAVMDAAHRRHEAILGAIILAHGGSTYQMIGDALHAAFPTAPAALAAAVVAQRALAAELWSTPIPLRVRLPIRR
jgi:class 3 adenylate cyclase